jgi:cutinase
MPTYGVVVGDPLFDAVQKIIPAVTGYPVNYPASFAKDSKDKGAADVAAHLAQQSKACPDQKFVLVGYSQGGQVMHVAAEKLDKSVFPRIVAVVLFGDPGNRGPKARSPLGGFVKSFPAELENKLKQNCSKGDPVCTNTGTVTDEHLIYAEESWMKASAEYIQKQFKSGGKAGPEPSPNGGPNDIGDNSVALEKLGKELGASSGEIATLKGSVVRMA